MRYNLEQIMKPEKLGMFEQQPYREKLYFEEELRKLVPDLIKAEGYGMLSGKGMRNFCYYTTEKPNERQYSYYEIKNGQITFTGLLNAMDSHNK